MVRFTLPAPDLVDANLVGRQPSGMDLADLRHG
jgi:hypothetical protein